MKRALFPGSFDPPTLGHEDIIRRAAALSDELVIGVGRNAEKEGVFSTDECVQMLHALIIDLPNVRIAVFDGLVTDFAKDEEINCLIRGVRAFSDFEYECRMALANRVLSGIETLFLLADPKLSHISSSLIRDIAGHGAHLHDFVPAVIEKEVCQRLSCS